MEKEISIKRIGVNLKMNRKFIEVEIPGDDILASVDPNADGFEALVKEKVIEFIKCL